MKEMEIRYITTLKEMRIINDPYRQEILKTLDSAKKPLTAKEIADIMDEAPSKVNYHVGILAKHDFIELDHTDTINGIIAKYYKTPSVILKIRFEGKNAKEKEMSALRDIIVSTYDSARDLFITHIARKIENQENPKAEDLMSDDDFLLSKKVYLSENDRKELLDFFDRVSHNKENEGTLHNLFLSTIELEDKD